MPTRSRSPFTRALALFLCAQPALWMSNVPYAQTLQQQAMDAGSADQQRIQQQQQLQLQLQQSGSGSPSTPGATAPEQEALRLEQPRSQQPSPTATPVDEPVDPARYVLGPNDVLELHFWGVENFRLRVTVDLEGRAFVPKVGYLALQGKTLAEAQVTLEKFVARYFPKLAFGVRLAEPRTFLVQVVDAVNRPGSYPARALDRVASVLQRSGGLAPNGSRRRVEVKRRDGTVVRADLLLYALTGDVKHNPYVLDGDVVRVPFQTLVASIDGAVNRP